MYTLTIKPDHNAYREILNDFGKMASCFDLVRGNLWHDVCDLVAGCIHVQMDMELDPDGVPWADLSPTYAQWKQGVAPGRPIGELFGVMKTMTQLTGEVIVTRNQITQKYGVDDVAKTEAWKFTEGGLATGTNQPPRPFYEFNTAAIAALDGWFDHVFQTAF
jgi:hypothetical protein